MINPKYEYLREYVERIPKDFETIGTVIHSGRNLIKMITVDGLDINVKRYTIPPLINRIAYAFFRPSKGLLFIRRNCWRKGLKPHVLLPI